MARPNMRKTLGARNRERFRAIATVKQFSSRRGWSGPESTILLGELFDAEIASKLCDHLWFKKGRWVRGLNVGDWVSFDAREDRRDAVR